MLQKPQEAPWPPQSWLDTLTQLCRSHSTHQVSSSSHSSSSSAPERLAHMRGQAAAAAAHSQVSQLAGGCLITWSVLL